MKRTKRISALLSCLKTTDSFADIGCDHGFLSYYALSDGIVKSALLCDISELSLQKARRLFADRFSDCTSFYVSDGFENLPKDLPQAAICGMGGMEISAILEKAKALPKFLLLSPQKNARQVRELVLRLGYGVDSDFLVQDCGKFYPVIACTFGGARVQYSQDELDFGKDSLEGKGDFGLYLDRQLKKLEAYAPSVEKEKKLLRFKALKNEIDSLLRNRG